MQDIYDITIEHLYVMFKECDLILTDSRQVASKVNEGFKVMFFALKGDRFDANGFVEEVLESGATCVVTSRKDIKDSRVALYHDTLEALQRLAAHHREQLNCKVVAITGSNGKTTTKELMVAILSQKYSVAYTKGNFNNHIGVPLTLLSIKESDEIAIVEHGANHIGEIKFLVTLSQPDFGLITNIGRAHIGEFGGVDGIVKAKGELYDYLKNNNKTLFYNTSLPYLSEMVRARADMQVVAYDESIVCQRESDSLSDGVVFEYEELTITSNLIGSYNIHNITAAIAVAQYFKLLPSQIKSAIEGYIPSNMRSQLVKTATNRVVVDAYNANPSSMLVAIENFAKHSQSRSICILGQMHELGSFSGVEHAKLVDTLVDLSLEAILIGEHFKQAAKESDTKWFDSVESLIDSRELERVQNYDILLKGSRATSVERLINYL
ncbi:MAG: UDP-N-acetylmuramoyl-tripeptide--D-alanyl-D-alanine ligase [Rikenellaceae bacterium]